jgi:Tol biopolymer transport system component
MGGTEKSEAGESFKFINQGFNEGGNCVRFFLMCGFCMTLLACQSKSKKTELPAEVDYLQSKDASIILSQGYNRSAVFSDDGDKIFYISKNRKGHKNTQIHEYDLTLQTDRRMTFQDGEVLSVIPLNDQIIVYASNTDEIKEEPFAGEKDPSYPKAEIYQSDMFGAEITRLTNNSGFDGEMIYVPGKKQLLFVSLRSGLPGLYWLDLQTEKVTPFYVDKEKVQRSPALSDDGKSIYWIEEDAKDKMNSIVTATILGKNRKVVRSLKGTIKSVLPNRTGQVVYSWLPEGAEFSQVDYFDAEKTCTQTLLKSKLNFSEPQFSVKNPNLMIFRVSNNDKSQIYRWQLPVDLGPCNEQVPSDTMKK